MKNLKTLSLVAAAMLLLASCGGGGDSGAPTLTATTASVGIILTDSSAIDGAIAAVVPAAAMENNHESMSLWVTFSSVELRGDDGNQVIFLADADDPAKMVDLFTLKDSLELFFVNEAVMPGTYNKIRMQVDSVELCTTETADSVEDCEDVKMPSGKIDFNPRDEFTIVAGDIVLMTLDVDANKSIKLTENPNKKILRPVVFVTIDSNPAFEEGLVRVSGVVAGQEGNGFLLCSAEFATPLGMANTQSELNEMCIDVVVTSKTGLFNETGEPVEVDMLPKDVTVIGLLQLAADEGDLPLATPLAEAAEIMPTPFQIVAAVVEGGVPETWDRYRGALASDFEPDTELPGSGTFKFAMAVEAVPAADEVPEVPAVLARVYEKSRIFALSIENGLTEIAADSLQAGDLAILEAVIPPKPVPPVDPVEPVEGDAAADEEATDGLRVAIMVVLQDAVSPEPELLRGKIESVTPAGNIGNEGTLSVISDDSLNAVCVNSSSDTAIYRLTGKEDSIQAEEIQISELMVSERISIAGTLTVDECVDAAVMIAGGPINP